MPAFYLALRAFLGIVNVATCVCGSLGSRLYTIVNGWLGREKHVLETERNSLSEHTTGNTSPTTASVHGHVTVPQAQTIAHAETCN